MADTAEKHAPPPSTSVVQKLHAWGSSGVPPSVLATLTIALHLRPRQPMALVLFPGPLFFATYLNLAGYTTGAAGVSAAWSGLYALMALRRKQGFRQKFLSARGGLRGAAIAMGVVNAVAGGWRYATGSWEEDERERVDGNRWG